MRKREVCPGKMHHICQRSHDGGLLFYSPTDCLVFFTIFCTLAERMEIPVAALCLMPDHVHQLIIASDRQQLASFQKECSRLFAREWNRSRERKGPVFRHGFGSTVPGGDAQIRSTLAYNYNRPVERLLCPRAEQYRWNFLAYALRPHPFSAALDEPRASRPLRRALQEARYCQRHGTFLRYRQLDRWFRELCPEEARQLTDALIGLWNVVDYRLAASYYDSLEGMIRSFHEHSGSGYAFRKEGDSGSDAVYKDFSRLLLKEKRIRHVRDIPMLPDWQKAQLAQMLGQRTPSPPRQIGKYLHWHPDAG